MKIGVPALLTGIDGSHVILFHVEHSSDETWHYRWRLTGDIPPGYGVWRDATTRAPYVCITSEVWFASMEVLWRPDGVEEWSPVDALRLGTPEALFSFRPVAAFHHPEPFMVCSAVRQDGVAAYQFPPLTVAAGEEAIVHAVADAPAWANVLLHDADFHPAIPGIEIHNLGPSSAAWQILPHSGAFPLWQCPVSAARRWFAVSRDALTPASLLSPTPIS